ncbi:MAG: hypothetical protein UV05_C0025G0004 [candidate division CPR1 bacterium GW2011_GWA2_42_17]|uniref:Uncharacterized protein n=1 Tax=candidate division CPR1 bacterium GW2011_GWA2_42_17 TaxID=1618341 RepID=A0A0G0Z4M4_9BACT|nr:MAG: hypothetical protein UV05_C0025G0004 [candidate division CPR1 bacterium GW2011_GWA2_42_17]
MQSIEEDNLISLPKPPFVFGLVKNYAKALSLNSEEVLAIFRREYNLRSGNYLLPPQPLIKSFFHLNGPAILKFSLIFLTFLFLGYLLTQYWQFAQAPVLIVSAPQDLTEVLEAQINVIGRTDPNAKVYVNGQEILVDEKGIFNTVVSLNPGVNVLNIVSRNSQKKETQIKRTVTVKNDH